MLSNFLRAEKNYNDYVEQFCMLTKLFRKLTQPGMSNNVINPITDLNACNNKFCIRIGLFTLLRLLVKDVNVHPFDLKRTKIDLLT